MLTLRRSDRRLLISPGKHLDAFAPLAEVRDITRGRDIPEPKGSKAELRSASQAEHTARVALHRELWRVNRKWPADDPFDPGRRKSCPFRGLTHLTTF